MSMTREEATAKIGHIIDCIELGIFCGEDEEVFEALDLALAGLRGPTRKMVERMFRGCEVCKSAKYVTGSVSAVAPHDDQHEIETDAEGDFDFCPNCGRPLTDEAVDMMLERWKEALYENIYNG